MNGVVSDNAQLNSLLKQSATPYIWFTKYIDRILSGDIRPDHRALSLAGSPKKRKTPEESPGKTQQEDGGKPKKKQKKSADDAFVAFHSFFLNQLDLLFGFLNKDWASNRNTKKRVDSFLVALNEKGRNVSEGVWKNLVVVDGVVTEMSDEESETSEELA